MSHIKQLVCDEVRFQALNMIRDEVRELYRYGRYKKYWSVWGRFEDIVLPHGLIRDQLEDEY